MSKKLFEHNINLIIADASISVCDTTDFSTYSSFAVFINSSIKNKNFSNIERYLTPMINELTYIMGIPVRESAIFVAKYFKFEKWKVYHKPIKLIKEQFNIFLVKSA